MSAPSPKMTRHYVWSVEGKAVSVQLSLEVVGRLQPAVAQAAVTGPERTPELGGLLLGYVRKVGDCTFVSVEDFEEIPCQHLRCESWHLSLEEKNFLEGRI